MNQLPVLPQHISDLPSFITQLRGWLFASQKKAAAYFSVSRSRITHWETGEKPPLGYVVGLVHLQAKRSKVDAIAQEALVEAVNRIINTCYRGNKPFYGWHELSRAADTYLARRRTGQAPPDIWLDTKDFLLTLTPRMEQAGLREELVPHLERGIEQSRKVGDVETEAELHLQLGTVRQLQSHYANAQQEFNRGHHLYQSLNDTYGQARALNLLAFVALRQHHLDHAIAQVESALKLLAAHDAERAFSYFVLGMVALEQRDWPQAMGNFEQSHYLWEENNNPRMMGRTLTLMGSALRRQKKYREAINAYRQAIDLLKTVDDPVHRAMAQMNLGNVYLSLEQPEKSLSHYHSAGPVFEKAQDQLHLAHIQHNLGMAYSLLQQFDLAEMAFLESVDLWHQIGHRERLANTLDELAQLYRTAGHHNRAKAVLHEALATLKQIEGEPGYAYRLKTVAAHLHKVTETINLQPEHSQP